MIKEYKATRYATYYYLAMSGLSLLMSFGVLYGVTSETKSVIFGLFIMLLPLYFCVIFLRIPSIIILNNRKLVFKSLLGATEIPISDLKEIKSICNKGCFLVFKYKNKQITTPLDIINLSDLIMQIKNRNKYCEMNIAAAHVGYYSLTTAYTTGRGFSKRIIQKRYSRRSRHNSLVRASARPRRRR